MTDNLKTQQLLEEMRIKGNLPAINENVQAITRITNQSHTRAVDLATVIMRDCGLTSNILATANSVMYRPRYPIKTITYAVTFLGFEKVRSLALGLSMFNQTMKTAKTQQLGQLYASSYFSGAFARSLAAKNDVDNPEEIFIAGLLYRLPWLALANTFPKKFEEMEKLIVDKNISNNKACKGVFGAEYDEICKALTNIYNLPDKVAKVLRNDDDAGDPLIALIRESGHISNMLFSNKLGGEKAMGNIEARIKKILETDEFNISDFIKDTCEQDANVARFFNLEKDDVDMMVKALEWGKGNPAQIAGKATFGDALTQEEKPDDPDVLIGQFLTDLMIGCRKNTEINQVLMLAQEALYRCLIGTEIFTAFLNKSKTMMTGRFYAGKDTLLKAEDFKISMIDNSSPIVRSINNKETAVFDLTERSFRISLLKYQPHFKTAMISPVITMDLVIGAYFIARANDIPFSEKEIAWFEQIVIYVGQAFENSKK
ncbi:MAG: HDOD domain-containing protein [Deltaproteobacteria bacterium]|nr:HDOD domain-containing protein [Deltaproteobacteria bacterium]